MALLLALSLYSLDGCFTGVKREMLFITIPTKWISADGKTLWAIYTGGQDRFNLVKATLSR